MTINQKVEGLAGVASRIAVLKGKTPFWSQPLEDTSSVLLNELYLEWLIHYFTAVKTLDTACDELRNWDSDGVQCTALTEDMTDWAMSSLATLLDALEANQLGAFFTLNAATLDGFEANMGISPSVALFDVAEAQFLISRALKSQDNQLATVGYSLALMESSMRHMMLLSLWAESRVGSLTGRFGDSVTLPVWKAPIVRRMMDIRRDLVAEEIRPELIRFDPAGFWPEGLQG